MRIGVMVDGDGVGAKFGYCVRYDRISMVACLEGEI